MVAARFTGGPFDGMALALIGTPPGYLMLMRAPPGVAMNPVVVGADFDDHWPGQQRYDLVQIADADAPTPSALYHHVEAPD
jgi:hypothetical protein